MPPVLLEFFVVLIAQKYFSIQCCGDIACKTIYVKRHRSLQTYSPTALFARINTRTDLDLCKLIKNKKKHLYMLLPAM